MGKRGPQPKKGNLTVLDKVAKKHPKPLPGMTAPAREIWKRIIEAYPPDHFKPQHFDQLRSYCEAAAAYKKAVFEIEKRGVLLEQSNGVLKRNPWCNERDACAGTIAQLGTKLGITRNATTMTRESQGEEQKPKSKREGLMFGE